MSLRSRAQSAESCTLTPEYLQGPNANHLAQHTGYPREFVGALIEHMEEGGLWTNGLLDDQEWWDANGELNGVALFTPAHVALGLVRREPTCMAHVTLIQKLES